MSKLPIPRAVIESKERGRAPTCWVVLHYREGDTAFLKRAVEVLGRVGWTEDKSFPYIPASALGGVAELCLESKGSAIFNGWTATESRKKLASLRSGLATLGLPVYRRKLTLADML